MDYTKPFRLGLRPNDVPYVVSAKQNDCFTRFLQVQLTRDDINYTPGNGVTYLFRCRRPDGALITEDSTTQIESRTLVTDLGNGIIQIELTDDALAVPGRCLCDLCMTKDEQVLSTDLFVIDVVASPNVSSGTLT